MLCAGCLRGLIGVISFSLASGWSPGSKKEKGLSLLWLWPTLAELHLELPGGQGGEGGAIWLSQHSAGVDKVCCGQACMWLNMGRWHVASVPQCSSLPEQGIPNGPPAAQPAQRCLELRTQGRREVGLHPGPQLLAQRSAARGATRHRPALMAWSNQVCTQLPLPAQPPLTYDALYSRPSCTTGPRSLCSADWPQGGKWKVKEIGLGLSMQSESWRLN